MARTRTDILFWWPAPTPFLAGRWRAASRKFRLKVLFLREIDTKAPGPGNNWLIRPKHLDYPHEFIRGPSIVKAIRGFVIALRERPRVIITVHAWPQAWPAFLMRLFGARVWLWVVKTHDSWLDRTRFKEALKKQLFRMADGFVTPGPDGSAYVRQYRPDAHILRLRHALDISIYPAAEAIDFQFHNPIRFLYLGRLIPKKKGIDVLMAAFDKLRGEGYEAMLDFVGSGEMEDELRTWASRHPDSVAIRSYVQPEDVPQMIAGHDVLLFPTTGDPYGLVVDEAMASGLLVVASPHAGEIRHRLGADEATRRGLLLPDLSPDSLAAAMASICRSPQEFVNMRRAGRKYVEDTLVLDRWISDLSAVLDATR